MKIKDIKIENFKSIKYADLSFYDYNILVGQNNHGKTNYFDAVKWFFSGFDRSVTKDELINSDCEDSDILVEITFSGLQDAISNMSNATKNGPLRIFLEIVRMKLR